MSVPPPPPTDDPSVQGVEAILHSCTHTHTHTHTHTGGKGGYRYQMERPNDVIPWQLKRSESKGTAFCSIEFSLGLKRA